ncbi:hypothetical protein [Aristaeella hokkaidonensis]|uniref:Uncharacterized protein n=1 Tax=Aristaeella hokkaidonensis TaxID=3046382 RepID=A0AC61MXL5_9FIRM|nr:hypothetical protein [Aristaeella hokkaidonensis]QUC67566.1 hypothetical protein JYE49_02370 [Aristaeella hokkaidonensis]SNT92609.1 hypothetical protein SAMN06297421_101154 [Aristaeella hokkaidonensis]
MNLTVRENQTETENKPTAFRNKASRIRIIAMTVMDVLFSWLACGVTYAAIQPGLPFRHALISPIALFIMIPESAAWFYLIRTIRNGSR